MKRLKFFTVIVLIFIILMGCLVQVHAINPPIPTPSPSASPAPSDSTGDDGKDKGIIQGVIDGIGGFFGGIGDLASSIIDIPKNFFTMLIRDATTGAVMELVDFMNGFLNSVSRMIGKGDAVFSSPVITNLNVLLRPFAYNIMVLLFMAGITKKAAYMEAMSPMTLVESMALMMLAKWMVDHAVMLLSLIAQIITAATNVVLSYPSRTISTAYDVNGLVQQMQDNAGNDMFKLFGINAIIYISMFLLALCLLIVFVVLVTRQIELGVLTVASCLFMATVASSISNDVFKAFMKYFIGVCSQVLFMAIAMVIFTSSVFDYIRGTGMGMFGGFIEMLIGIVGLSIYIVRMPNSIKNIMGMGGGGSGLSIASIAALLL